MTALSDGPALVEAIHSGDLAAIKRILDASPDIAGAQLGGNQKSRTPLHVVADWPGYFPNGAQTVRMLIDAGADPNGRISGQRFEETPLHWAASSDDLDVALALIDGGADIEAANGSIGTPLGNAVGYGCWHVARLLIERGAKVDLLWHAAALGLMSRLEELLPRAEPEAISQAFWHACAGGQRRVAEHLLSGGADVNWIPTYAKGTPLDAAGGRSARQDTLITWLRAQGAQSAKPEQK